ncbi:hypothetical protein LCGC14_1250300 [marine sediment metagenome]|uniref:Uncharacterized protein n=1 Tax=marine sediment metagenome TaxID=412755 RepID=A0A0F9NKI4_9ZZZZ
MGIGITEITMAQLAGVVGRYSNVIYMNDPSDTDLLKTIVGSPRTIIINLGQLLNISDGEVQGDAIAIDELTATQIAAGAVAGLELASVGSLFDGAAAAVTVLERDFSDGDAQTLLAANASTAGARVILVQAHVTEAFVLTSFDWDVGSTANPNGLFDDLFAGLATIGLRESETSIYILPANEALVLTEIEQTDGAAGAGKVTFRILDLGAVDAARIADDAVTNAKVLDGTLADAKLASSLVKDVGALANGVLRVTGVTVDGQTVTIGSDIFEIDPITVDSTDDTEGGNWNNVTDPLTVTMTSALYPQIGVGGAVPLVVGELIYIGTEYLRVTGIVSDDVTFERGAGGSSAATHADAQDIFVSAGTPAPTDIPVGVQGTFSAAVVTPILAATINEDAGVAGQANAVDAVSLSAGAVMLITADAVGAVVLATTETHGNGAWDTTAMRRGAVAAVRSVYRTAVVPDSEEVTANEIMIPLPFDPVAVVVQIKVTSTGVNKLWVGDTIITAASSPVPAYVTLNNDGATNFDGSDTITVIAFE